MQAYTPITPPPTPRKSHQFSSECGILSPTTTVPSRTNPGVPNSPARSPSYAVTFSSNTPANDAAILTHNSSQSNISSQEGNFVNDERLSNILNYCVVPANQNPIRESLTNATINDATRLTENYRDRSLSNTIINNVSKSNTNTTKTHNCFKSTAKSDDVIESAENQTRFSTNNASRNDVLKNEENSEFVISVKLPSGTNNAVFQQKAELLSRLLTQTFQSDIDSDQENPIILQDPPKGKQSHRTTIPVVDTDIRNDNTSSSTDCDNLTTTINDVAVSAVGTNNITLAKVDHHKQLASQDSISNKSMDSIKYTPPTEPCDLSINSKRKNQHSISNISYCHSPMYTNCSSKTNELTPTHSRDVVNSVNEKFPVTPHKTNENSYFIFPDVTQNANIHGYCDTPYSDRQQHLHCDNSTNNNANSMSCDQTQTYSNAALHRSSAPSSSSSASMVNNNLNKSPNSAQIPTSVHSYNSKIHTPSKFPGLKYVISNAEYSTTHHPIPPTHEQTNIISQNSPYTAHFLNQHRQNDVKFQEHLASNQNQDKCVSLGCCNTASREQITHNSVTRNDVTFANHQEVERCKRNLFGSPKPPRSPNQPGISDDVINLLRSRGILNDDQMDYIASESHHSIPCSSHSSDCQSFPINSDTCQSHSYQPHYFDSDTCQSSKRCQSHTAIRDTCQSSYRNHNNSMDDQYPSSPSYQVIIIPSSPRKRRSENLSNIDDVTPSKKCACSPHRAKSDDVLSHCNSSHPSCRENCHDIRSSPDRSHLPKSNYTDSSPINGCIELSQQLLNRKYENIPRNVSDTDGLSNKTSKRPRCNASHIGESGMSSVGKRLGNGSCSNHKQKCSCSVFETHILNMARGAYKKVGRYNSSQGAFEQFRKELSETNGIVLDSLRMLNDMKRMCCGC